MVSELRVGDCIEYNSKAMIIQNLSSNQVGIYTCLQVGRGSRSYVLQCKDPSTGSQSSIKPSAKDSFEKVDLRDKLVTLLYTDGTELVGMEGKTLEQISVPLNLLTSPTPNGAGATALLPFLESGTEVRVRYWGDVPVSIIPPRIVKCTVKEVVSVLESMESKKTTVNTLNGARVVVPVRVEADDVILVNLDDCSYNGKV